MKLELSNIYINYKSLTSEISLISISNENTAENEVKDNQVCILKLNMYLLNYQKRIVANYHK